VSLPTSAAAAADHHIAVASISFFDAASLIGALVDIAEE
jgi:hypothetical protein